MGPLSQQLGNLAMGGGGFGPDFMRQAFQQTQSMMAPAMRQAQSSLNFSQMQRGVFDSGVAQQQQGQLQGAFLSSLNRNALDIVHKNEMQRRQEMMQGMSMLMTGITPGATMQTPPSMSQGGAIAQGTLGAASDAMSMYALGNMFQGGNQNIAQRYNQAQQQTPSIVYE